MSRPPVYVPPEGDLPDLVARVLAGRGQRLEDAMTLPPDAYTSRAFFDLEAEKIFRHDWLCVGHESQIPNVGDYFTLDVLNEPVVVVRRRSGIAIMSRVCLHRWAPVVEGSGNAKGFSCPFHRWGYSLEGELTAAPYMDRAAGFDRHKCRLPEFRSEIVDGVIYMTFNRDAYSIRERLADFSAMMATRYDMDDLVVGWQVDYECNFNWKIAVETFMECYHHIGAHGKSLEPTMPGRLSFVDDSRELWTTCWHPLREGLTAEEVIGDGLPVIPTLSAEQRRTDGLVLVYPMTLYGLAANRVSVTGLLPIGPEKTLWRRNVLVPRAVTQMPDFAEKVEKAKAIGDLIANEDLEVNDLQQVGAASATAVAGRLSHLEKVVWQLADFVRNRIGE